MSKYKISIIIPTYNAEKYLKRCVGSVINQTFGFENIELLLIDDNSTDKTKEIIYDLSKRYDNIVSIINEKNSGSPSKPRNIGIENASSDFIMFMDNDDYFYPEMCEVMYDTIIKENVDVVGCGYEVSINDGKPFVENSFLIKEKKFIKVNNIKEYPKIMNPTATTIVWNKIFRSEILKNNHIRFPEGVLYEDVCFMSQVYIKARGIVLLNDYMGYVYCLRTEGDDKSTSRDYNEENLIKQLDGMRILFNILDENNANFPSLTGSMLIGWTKLFILTNPPDYRKYELLNETKELYKKYSLFVRISSISLLLNIMINIFIKIFMINNTLSVFLINIYNKFKDKGWINILK